MTTSPALLLTKDKSLSHLAVSLFQILGASLFIALCSQIFIPLYFTPVPVSLQTFAVMLVGATMGSRIGVLSVLAYILEGVCGLPVFSHMNFGFSALYSVTGGYIFGFVLQAYLIGYCLERRGAYLPIKILAILFSSCLLQLGLGALWLSKFVGFEQAILLGVTPFVAGEIMKCLAITAYLRHGSNKVTPS